MYNSVEVILDQIPHSIITCWYVNVVVVTAILLFKTFTHICPKYKDIRMSLSNRKQIKPTLLNILSNFEVFLNHFSYYRFFYLYRKTSYRLASKHLI